MRIGTLAERLGTTPDAIRFYERRGLLPGPERTDNGYRQYTDRVWGHDHDGGPRTVDVHVRWLRSKIEPKPDAPVHLVTVRGVGYRLDPSPR